MDKRILVAIAGFWIFSLSLFACQKMGNMNKEIKVDYRTPTISDNTTTVGQTNRFEDKTEGANDWKWSFGDGQYSFGKQNTSHAYSEPGSYTVELTVYGTFGFRKHNSRIIKVLENVAEPSQMTENASILGVGTAKVGERIVLNSSVEANSYVWTVENEPQYAGSQLRSKEASFLFKNPGAKIIHLDIDGKVIRKQIVVEANEVVQSKPSIIKQQQQKVRKREPSGTNDVDIFKDLEKQPVKKNN